MFFIAPITEAMAMAIDMKLQQEKQKALELATQSHQSKDSSCKNCGAPHEHGSKTCSYCLSPVN